MKTSDRTRVYAIVLNWNNYPDTKNCLESLQQATYPDLKIVVVDNASADGSGKRLQQEFEQHAFVFNEANLGFARGCNRGIRVALEDQHCAYVFLINNDAVITPDAISEAVGAAAADERIGLVSGKVLLSERRNTIWYAGGHIDRWRGHTVARGFGEIDHGQYDSACEVGFVTGASMLIKREVLDRVGLLPEEYFFCVEDWDYSHTVRDAGYSLYYVPRCVVFHKADGSHWNYDPKFVYNAYRGKLIFQEKYLPSGLFPIWLKAFEIYGKFLARRARARLIKIHGFDVEEKVRPDDLDFAFSKAIQDHGKTRLSEETLLAFERELEVRRELSAPAPDKSTDSSYSSAEPNGRRRLVPAVPRNSNGNAHRVSIAMIGARMHFAVPIILANAGFLDTFFTDVHLGNKTWLYRLVNSIPMDARPRMIKQLCGRTAPGVPPERIVSFDVLGLWYLLKRQGQMSFGELTELFAKVNRLFGDRVVRRGLGNSNAVWGFNGAALEIFKHAREKGITCILEQTIAPRRIERELLLEEAIRWPQWQPGLDIDLRTGLDLLAEREEAEWELADQIICGSNFVLEGLKARGVSTRKCSVVPYGVEMDHLQPAHTAASKKNLNVLFAGEIGLRKGVPYLLEALRAIDSPESIHVKLVGSVAIDRPCLARYDRWCEVVGPVPRSQMSELYDWADVLVLPSICEGSATVTYEAMARGLPIITTPNSGSLIRDGVDGFVVPIRDANALAENILLLSGDSILRTHMANAAIERSQEVSLEKYGNRLLGIFNASSNGDS